MKRIICFFRGHDYGQFVPQSITPVLSANGTAYYLFRDQCKCCGYINLFWNSEKALFSKGPSNEQ